MRFRAKVVIFLVAHLKQPLHGLALHLDLEINAIVLSLVQGGGVQGILHVLAAFFVLGIAGSDTFQPLESSVSIQSGGTLVG